MATSALKNRYLAALDPTQSSANQATSDYLGRAESFDPTAALKTYGDAAYSGFSRNLNVAQKKLRGQEVGMGRLDTGFGTEDEDRLTADLAGRYQQDLAGKSLEAEGLGLKNTEDIGQFGQNQQNQYLDLLTGGLDRETADANAKKAMWSNILGSVLGAGSKIATMGIA